MGERFFKKKGPQGKKREGSSGGHQGVARGGPQVIK